MDVVSQAISVAAEASETSRQLQLLLDLNQPSHRAAYAAAVAVLATFGENVSDHETELPRTVRAELALSVGESTLLDTHPMTAAVRRGYLAAITDVAGDTTRAERITNDTFSTVRDLLVDGANVEAVAQVQYRLWVDAQGELPMHRA